MGKIMVKYGVTDESPLKKTSWRLAKKETERIRLLLTHVGKCVIVFVSGPKWNVDAFWQLFRIYLAYFHEKSFDSFLSYSTFLAFIAFVVFVFL